MRGVIYARYSEGPRQTDQSIEGQVADCSAYAAAHGIDVVQVYADRHVSGKAVDGRDAFLRMMADADRGAFDCVIVWKVDRFGRSREDIAVNKIRLRRAGVSLFYAKESIPDGPEGILLESLMEGLAEYYSADLRQKVMRGQRESAKKGRLPFGFLPIGYVRGADGQIVVDPPAADAVREVFRMQLAGATIHDLQEALFSRGFRGRSGSLVSKATIHRMLRNTRYLGRFSYQDIEIEVDPIIDAATFAAVQDSFETSRNAAGRSNLNFMLSCKCTCAVCGKLLPVTTGTGKLGGKYSYYHCRTKCIRPIRTEKLDDLVLRETVAQVLTDDMIGQLADRIMEIQEADLNSGPAAGIRADLEENARRRKNLADAMEASGRVSFTITDRIAELEAEAERLQADLDRALFQHVMIPRDYVMDWLRSFRSGDVADPAFRRRLASTFIAGVVVGDDRILIAYNATGVRGSSIDRLLEKSKRWANFLAPVVVDNWILLCVPRAQK